jgi:type II secretory pathway component PulJ
MNLHPPRRGRAAFTLVEVLVSSVILLVLIALLLGMGDRMTGFWHASEGRRRIQREILAAIRVMEDDLRHAVVTDDPATLTIGSTTAAVGLPDNHSLFFLTSEEGPGIHDGGGLSAVGYFVAESPEKPGQWNLYRFRAPEKETREAVAGKTLSALYAKATARDGSTTERLSENIVAVGVAGEPDAGMSTLLRITVTGIPGPLTPGDPPSVNASRITREGRRVVTFVRLPPRVEGGVE